MERLMQFMSAARIVAAFLMYTVANAQNNPPQHQPPQGEFYQIFRERMARIDSLKTTLPDSVVYSEGGELNELMRWYSYWQPRLAPHGDFDNYERMVSAYWEREKQRGIGQRANEDPWHEIGPTRRRNQMLGIGPIRSIAISDVDPDHMLCTSNSGGVFYTTNATTDCFWQNAGTDIQWPRSGSRHALFYPGQLNQWFAVNGERLGYTGGIRRKLANSTSWDPDPIFDHTDAPDGDRNLRIEKLVFDPNAQQGGIHRLFACTSRGLYFTDDPTASDPTWTASYIPAPLSILAAFPDFAIDLSRIYVNDLAYSADENNMAMCAAMEFVVNEEVVDPQNNSISIIPHKVWRFMTSTDNGGYWQEIESQPPVVENIGKASVETTPAAPSLFYCLTQGASSWVKTFDWSQPSQPWVQRASGFNPGFGGGHAFAVDSENSESFIVGNGIDVNWYLNGSLVAYTYVWMPGLHSTGHDDTEYILSDPAVLGQFWIGHHGGVSTVITTTNPRTWIDKSDGLGVAETWSMSTSQNKPDYLALGLYHDANILTRGQYNADWNPDWEYLPLYGDGTHVLVNPKNSNEVYYADQYYGGLTWRRTDMAETTPWVYTTIGADINSQYYAKGDLHRIESNVLFRTKKITVMGVPPAELPIDNYENEIFRSDKGVIATEVQISNFANNIEATAKSVPGYELNNEQFWWIRNNPANPGHLYASQENWSYQARLWRTTISNSTDLAALRSSWHEVPHPRRAPLQQDPLRPPNVAGIAFDTEDENTVYISYNGSSFVVPEDFEGDYAQKMVFRLNLAHQAPGLGQFDCANTPYCDDLTMNLPNTIAMMNGLVFEQGSDGGLYIATDFGVYFTNNKRIAAYDPDNPEDAHEPNSSGWTLIGSNLPHVGSNGLEINYQVNKIRVGLYGRGAWEHDLYCPPDPSEITESGNYDEDAFVEASGSITSDAIVGADRKVRYRAGESVRLQPGFHAQTGSRFHSFIHPCNAPGNSFNPKMLPVGATESSSSVGRAPVSPGLTLSPNPTQGQTNVNCPSIPKDGTAQLRLIDARGRIVRELTMENAQHSLDLAGLHGLFVVVVHHGSAKYSARLSVP